MKKYALLLLIFSTPLWAALGDPVIFTLPEPLPTSTAQPFPVPISPARPADAPEVDTHFEPLNFRLDALWGPNKIRIQNAKTIQGLTVLCQVEMYNSICQANFLQAYTDEGVLNKLPLDRRNPSSSMAVSGFTKYFDLQIQGNTSCKLNVTCEYIVPRTQ